MHQQATVLSLLLQMLASDITKFPISTIQSAKYVWYLRAQTAIIGIATQKSYFIARGKLG